MTRAVAAVFGVLVAATFGAFFLAQRLKNTPSVIQSVKIDTLGPGAKIFSPNHDGRRDHARISLKLKNADHVTLTIVDAEGDAVRRLLDDHYLRAHQQLLPGVVWDGRGDDGRMVPDGRYKLRITLRGQGRSVIYPTSIVKDTTPPVPLVRAIGPERAYGPEVLPEPHGGPATAHFGPALTRPRVLLFRTGPGTPRQVLAQDLRPGATSWSWDGRVGGRRVSPGTYLVAVQWRDVAGNIGTSVPLDRQGLPVLDHGRLPGRGGITVRYLGARPPVTPVAAGAPVQFGVDSGGRRYGWDIRRIGAPRPRKRGGPKTKPQVTTGAPRGASGVYLFEARTRTHVTRVPFAVQGARSVSGTAARPHGVLVVLPYITWQGFNAVDDDGDGAPDTLPLGGPARLYRDFAGDGLPAGLADAEAPVLLSLDRSRRRYDVTTDAALVAHRGPRLSGHHGVLIPGDARWLPGAVRQDLRTFARRGGTVVSLGTDSLLRTVRIDAKGRLARPSARLAADVFGARIRPLVTRPTNLEIFQDDKSVQLFRGTTGVVANVPAWEESSVGREATLVSSAVTVSPPGRAVIVAARYGKGLVIRTGFPAFPARLSSNDPAITALMARMWALLSH